MLTLVSNLVLYLRYDIQLLNDQLNIITMTFPKLLPGKDIVVEHTLI